MAHKISKKKRIKFLVARSKLLDLINNGYYLEEESRVQKEVLTLQIELEELNYADKKFYYCKQGYKGEKLKTVLEIHLNRISEIRKKLNIYYQKEGNNILDAIAKYQKSLEKIYIDI